MNISETQAIKAKLAELEERLHALEMAQTGQKSGETVWVAKPTTLGLKKSA